MATIPIQEWSVANALVAAVLATFVCMPAATAGETIVDVANGFTLALPDGFVANPDFVGAAPRILHGFVLGDPTDETLDIMLFIEKLGGTIGRERLKQEQLPPGFQGRLFTTKWQQFEVDGFEIPEQIGDVQAITYNVQIPLKRAAIQVKLFGPADREAELKSLLTECLAGLKGESNWIQSAVPGISAISSKSYSQLLLAFAIVFILGGLVALWLISRSTSRGTVLGIAAVIYLFGVAFAVVRIREVMLLAGALKMLGFAGGILGIVDLVRRRKPKTESSP